MAYTIILSNNGHSDIRDVPVTLARTAFVVAADEATGASSTP